MPELILASSSPRRQQLLSNGGYRFRVIAPRDGAEPETIEGATPAELVGELARLKAEDVVSQLAQSAAADDWIVLAADTVAECAGRVLGKPRDEADARGMLSWMSGREHRVLTGVALRCSGAGSPRDGASEVVTTVLKMSPLGDDWLEPFLASGKWRGKAGAFGYQDGLGFVRIIEGSESNVVGLPMERVAQLLRERGCIPCQGEQT